MGHHRMGHTHHMHGGGMWGMDMFAYVPKAILFQKDLLGLSDEQVQKIRSIKQEMRKAGGNHDAIEKIHEQLESAFEGGQFDLATYESALKKAADYAVQARTETARKAQDALQVLNDDQRTRFLYSMQVMHQWKEMHGMKHKMSKYKMRGHGMGKESASEEAEQED
ncbi:MAG: periplasmic heavy metal sensor [Nitrococcus mobilis]|nr:periplasmic heavy metal sensor [Nitrococcus mobilis]